MIVPDYPHKSPSNAAHYDRLAAQVSERIETDFWLSPLVVDIGSNDGLLLKSFSRLGFRVVGVESFPEYVDNAIEKNGVQTLLGSLSVPIALDIVAAHGKASVVTFNNVFANIDDLSEICRALETLVDDNGIVIIESSYLFDMFDNLVFDFVYHEHLSYLSLKPLSVLFNRHGFRVFDCERLETKGGSMRYYVCRDTAVFRSSTSLMQTCQQERRREQYATEFGLFQKRIDAARAIFLDCLGARDRDGRLVGYGAGATSTTLLHAWRMGQHFDLLVDDNPLKNGKFSPGYNIPVTSFESLTLCPKDTMVILAWRFSGFILQRLKGFVGLVICPLPSLRCWNGKEF